MLRSCPPENFNPAIFFHDPAETYFHPGWYQPEDYIFECRCYQAEAPGPERLRTVPFTFGLKQVTETAAWIEFAAAPGPEPLTAAEILTVRDACRELGIRECLILPRQRNHLIDALLRTLPFRPIDRLIALYRSQGQPEDRPGTDFGPLEYRPGAPDRRTESRDLYAIDQSFPPIWRLTPFEFDLALNAASIVRILAARDSGEAVAYLLASCDEFSMHIDRVALVPERRGMGLGTKMIRRFVAEFSHEIDIFTVNTYEKNTAALRMYKKLGFIEESESYRLYAANI